MTLILKRQHMLSNDGVKYMYELECTCKEIDYGELDRMLLLSLMLSHIAAKKLKRKLLRTD